MEGPIAEKRSAFPRPLTERDEECSFFSPWFNDLMYFEMSSRDREYLGRSFSARDFNDQGYDWADVVESEGCWVALYNADDGMIYLATDWPQVGQYLKTHGDECVIVVKLKEETK